VYKGLVIYFTKKFKNQTNLITFAQHYETHRPSFYIATRRSTN